jgi:hypothetical protein
VGTPLLRDPEASKSQWLVNGSNLEGHYAHQMGNQRRNLGGTQCVLEADNRLATHFQKQCANLTSFRSKTGSAGGTLRNGRRERRLA